MDTDDRELSFFFITTESAFKQIGNSHMENKYQFVPCKCCLMVLYDECKGFRLLEMKGMD